jgi:hypothetical protein
VDLAVVEQDPSTWYVGTASAGVWKTTNAGTRFTPVFEREGSSAIGDVCVAPSNPEVVWVGTGENNARNSLSAATAALGSRADATSHQAKRGTAIFMAGS